MHNSDVIWTVPYKNVSSGICGQRRPRSTCTSAQSDQDLHCPLTESLDTIDSMESKDPFDTLRIRGMNLNLCIMRMLEDTFLLGDGDIVNASICPSA